MNVSKPLKKCRKRRNGDQKREESLPVINSKETCLLIEWSPALRWHDFYIGFYKERENQSSDVKGAVQVGNPCKDLSTNAEDWGGEVYKSYENSVMEWEQRNLILSNSISTTGSLLV